MASWPSGGSLNVSSIRKAHGVVLTATSPHVMLCPHSSIIKHCDVPFVPVCNGYLLSLESYHQKFHHISELTIYHLYLFVTENVITMSIPVS